MINRRSESQDRTLGESETGRNKSLFSFFLSLSLSLFLRYSGARWSLYHLARVISHARVTGIKSPGDKRQSSPRSCLTTDFVKPILPTILPSSHSIFADGVQLQLGQEPLASSGESNLGGTTNAPSTTTWIGRAPDKKRISLHKSFIGGVLGTRPACACTRTHA